MTAEDPELAAALAAIAEGPADDGARRVLADLLLERGDARGEFLLIQFLVAANQASGPLRRRGDELFRLHRRAWMAGAERVLCGVRLERGFPVEAELRRGARPHLAEALRSPMMATLRALSSSQVYRAEEDGVLVEVASSPRMRNLRAVTARSAAELHALAACDAPLALEALEVRPGRLTAADCAAFASAPALAAVRCFTFRTPWDEAAFRRWPERQGPPSPLAPYLDALARHPRLRAVVIPNERAAEPSRFAELVGLWERLPFERLQVSGALALTREPGGTGVLLQNLEVRELLALRGLLPRDTVRLQLAPRLREPLAERAELAAAFSALAPVILA